MRSARAPYTVTTGAAPRGSVVIPGVATENIMASMSPLIKVAALIAVMGVVPVRAQDSAAPPAAQAPAQVPPPRTPVQPAQPPQAASPEIQNSNPNSNENRFVFHRVDGGFLRLDMRTGAVASCRPNGAAWTCVPGRDERAALDGEIAQLQRDNALLKNALLEHGVRLPEGMAPNPPSAGQWGGETIPRPPQTVPPTTVPRPPAQGASPRSTLDRIVDAVEKGWRRLVEMMTNLRRELQQ